MVSSYEPFGGPCGDPASVRIPWRGPREWRRSGLWPGSKAGLVPPTSRLNGLPTGCTCRWASCWFRLRSAW